MRKHLWERYAVFTAIVVFAIVLRLHVVLQLPPMKDELQLARETIQINWPFVPVHFTGFGWGEHVTLGVLAYPFIKLFHWHPVAVFRVIVLCANIGFLSLLYQFARIHFSKSVAFFTLLFGALWPWSILAGSIGFNAFLVPIITMAIALFAERFYSTTRARYLYAMVVLAVLSLYTYAASFIWMPILALILLFTYGWPKLRARHVCGLVLAAVLAVPIFLVHAQSLWGGALPERFLIFSFPHLTSTRFGNVSFFATHGALVSLGYYALNYLLHFVFPYLAYVPLHQYQGAVEMLGGSGLYFLVNEYFYSLALNHGLFYNSLAFVWDVAFCVVGAFVVWRERMHSRGAKLLLLWLLLYPLGPSLVFGDHVAYTITRDIMGMPALILLSAIGCDFLYTELRKLIADNRRRAAP